VARGRHPGELEPAHPGEVYVDERHVGTCPSEEIEAFFSVAGLPDHLQVGFDLE
jgi:hypothetical protein